MIRRSFLGELELMILLAILRLDDNAYGVPISQELLATTGREPALGSIYAALERLEQKDLVSSTLGAPTPERGGRAKRFFQLTPAGRQAVHDTRHALVNLWTAIPILEGESA